MKGGEEEGIGRGVEGREGEEGGGSTSTLTNSFPSYPIEYEMGRGKPPECRLCDMFEFRMIDTPRKRRRRELRQSTIISKQPLLENVRETERRERITRIRPTNDASHSTLRR